MAAVSAGLLMYKPDRELSVYLVHPGGPYFRKKDKGWWTIPKGLPQSGETLLAAAIREFEEETGLVAGPPFIELGSIRQKGGKIVHCWSFENNSDEEIVFQSNVFSMEWPPRSGRTRVFPEIDKAEWMEWKIAMDYINVQQRAFIEKLREMQGI